MSSIFAVPLTDFDVPIFRRPTSNLSRHARNDEILKTWSKRLYKPMTNKNRLSKLAR